MAEPVEIFGALLDRSIAEIAEVAYDARRFDAGQIAMLADIWDNNSGPLFAAATGGWRRNALALKGLRRMGGFGARRREWMVGVEPALATLLPPVPDDDEIAVRDFRGVVRPSPRPLTAAEITGLATDYDLTAASIRSIAVDETLDGREIRLGVRVPRLYDCDRDDEVQLLIYICGTRALEFDTADRQGLVIERTDSGLALRWGDRGVLEAADGTVWPDDLAWDKSQAGRAADAELPVERKKDRRRDRGLVRRGWRGKAAAAAWSSLFTAMITVRRVRFRETAAYIPVYEVCDALSGAGAGIVAAGRLRGRARERAFDALLRTWQERGVEPPDRERPGLVSGPVHLRYASYSVGRQHPQVCVTAAIPSGDPDRPWRLAGEIVEDPARFTMTLGAFAGAQELSTGEDGFGVGDALVMRRC